MTWVNAVVNTSSDPWKWEPGAIFQSWRKTWQLPIFDHVCGNRQKTPRQRVITKQHPQRSKNTHRYGVSRKPPTEVAITAFRKKTPKNVAIVEKHPQMRCLPENSHRCGNYHVPPMAVGDLGVAKENTQICGNYQKTHTDAVFRGKHPQTW